MSALQVLAVIAATIGSGLMAYLMCDGYNDE